MREIQKIPLEALCAGLALSSITAFGQRWPKQTRQSAPNRTVRYHRVSKKKWRCFIETGFRRFDATGTTYKQAYCNASALIKQGGGKQ